MGWKVTRKPRLTILGKAAVCAAALSFVVASIACACLAAAAEPFGDLLDYITTWTHLTVLASGFLFLPIGLAALPVLWLLPPRRATALVLISVAPVLPALAASFAILMLMVAPVDVEVLSGKSQWVRSGNAQRSFWVVAMLSFLCAIRIVLRAGRIWVAGKYPAGCCRGCGYDLAGLRAERCPECARGLSR